MKYTVEARYEKGALRPVRPLAMREGQLIKITLERLPQDDESATPVAFDFTDLAGKLAWSGDALTAQRSLRDEWD